MSDIKKFLVRFAKDENGASLVEYSILLGIITAGAIATIVTVGGKVGTAWTTTNTNWTP